LEDQGCRIAGPAENGPREGAESGGGSRQPEHRTAEGASDAAGGPAGETAGVGHIRQQQLLRGDDAAKAPVG
ncbi:hypothetical protein DKP78_21060, partial [Enterococcus faecium]